MTAADFPNPPPILDPTCASKKRCCFSIWRGVLNRCFTAVRRFTSFTATCSGLPVAVSAGRYCRSQGDRSHSGANSSRTSMAVLLAVPFGRTGRSSSPMSNCSALSSSPIPALYTLRRRGAVSYVTSPNGTLKHGNAASPVTSTTATSVDANGNPIVPFATYDIAANDPFHVGLDEGRNFFRQNSTLRFSKHSVDDPSLT